MHDVLVVGAGMTGLARALEFRRARGRRVAHEVAPVAKESRA